MNQGEGGLAGYVPARRVGLFALKLKAAGYHHLTGRIDVDPRYTSEHRKTDGATQTLVRTVGLGRAVSVHARSEPDSARPIARFFSGLVGPDLAGGVRTLREDLKEHGIALADSPYDAPPADILTAHVPVYVAFDFDHDLELKQALIAQARHPDSPFEVADFSLKEAAPEKDWKEKARLKIRRVTKVIVIVGVHTHRAPGVRAEVQIAEEEGIRHFAIRGRPDQVCPRPNWINDEVHEWTWPNLKQLISE